MVFRKTKSTSYPYSYGLSKSKRALSILLKTVTPGIWIQERHGAIVRRYFAAIRRYFVVIRRNFIVCRYSAAMLPVFAAILPLFCCYFMVICRYYHLVLLFAVILSPLSSREGQSNIGCGDKMHVSIARAEGVKAGCTRYLWGEGG